MKKPLLLALIAGLFSCSYTHIHVSGTYVVEHVKADTASFVGMRGKYLVPRDSLLIGGDKIRIKVVKKRIKANIFQIQ